MKQYAGEISNKLYWFVYGIKGIRSRTEKFEEDCFKAFVERILWWVPQCQQIMMPVWKRIETRGVQSVGKYASGSKNELADVPAH